MERHPGDLLDPTIRLMVDIAVLTIRERQLCVLLIERGDEPFRGRQALPGGHLRSNEDVAGAAVRELREETGLDGSGLPLEQLPVASEPLRDPRGRVVTVPFLIIAPDLPEPLAGSDAADSRWTPVASVRSGAVRLAFDHEEILRVAVERACTLLEYTTLAPAFCGPEFTIGDLRDVYEVVWGVRLDPRNFNRKVTGTEGFVEQAGGVRAPAVGRPAVLYRRGPAKLLNPPVMRPV